MDFPVDHLSANSLKTFQRCPRQWQENYMFGIRGGSNVNLIIGDYAHRVLATSLKGLPVPDDLWAQTIEDAGEIDWKKISPETARNMALKHVYDYYETIGKWLNVIETEREISLSLPGVDVPIVGFVDIECDDRIIDVKTTGYFNRKVTLNPEWRLQANIYQLYRKVPAEFHVLTRSKTDPVVVPSHTGDDLYVAPPEEEKTITFIQQTYRVMKFYVDEFGENPWPGNVTHPWAEKYCVVKECCQR